MQYMPIDQIKSEGFAPGEKDERLIELLCKQIKGEITAEAAMLDIGDIEPFCKTVKLQQESLDNLKEKIRNGDRPDMLVYYRDGKFIMSDHYYTYYAYKGLEYSKVPCSVLGGIPQEYQENKQIIL